MVLDDRVDFKYKKPARELSGPYTIKISNAQGEDTRDITINFQDVPQPPASMEVSDIFQSSCIITWKPPKDDGGSPLVHYLIERQDLSVKGGWHSVAEAPAGDSTYKVEDLVHRKEYKFRVRAVNKLGPSEPVNYPKTVLAKDPWGIMILDSVYTYISNIGNVLNILDGFHLQMSLGNPPTWMWLTGTRIMLTLPGNVQ